MVWIIFDKYGNIEYCYKDEGKAKAHAKNIGATVHGYALN